MKNITVYDDYNRRVKSDQTCIGTVMPNFKNEALGNGTKLIEIDDEIRFRRLTPKECWRLMGFSDEDYEKAKTSMNNQLFNGHDRCGSQLYKQAGNSIVVDVLLHIMENLYDVMPYLFEDMSIGSFFSGIGAFEKALTRLGENSGGANCLAKNCDNEVIIVDDTMGFENEPRIYKNLVPSLRASRSGLKVVEHEGFRVCQTSHETGLHTL